MPNTRLALTLWALLASAIFAWGAIVAARSPVATTPYIPVQVGGASSLALTVVTAAERQPAAAGDAGVSRDSTQSASTSDLSSSGPGIAGAEVAVFTESGDDHWALAARATTDASGRVLLDDLPSGPAWLMLRASGYARISRQIVLYERQQLVLPMAPSRELVVKVEDEEAAPIRDATVLVQERDGLPFGRLTDEHGVARLSSIGAGPYSVQVFAKGYTTVSRERLDRDTRIVLARLGSLLVRALGANGDPVGLAEVQVVGTRLWPARRVQADDQGRVLLTGLPEGLYDLRAVRGQLVSPIVSNFQLERGQRREVELHLVTGRTVDVRVKSSDEDASPVPNARLVLAEHGLSAFPLTAIADDEGRALVGPLPPGPAFLSVRAEGFIGRGALPVPEENPMLVKLLRGGTVRGDVVDVDDRPIRDARVEVVGLDLDGLPIAESPLSAAYREAHFDFAMRPLSLVPAGELGVTYGPVPFVNMVTEGAALQTFDFSQLPPDYAPWSTNFEGKFRAFPVPPGRLRLIVRHHRYAEGQSRIFTMGPGGNVHVKVVLDEGNILRGRIVDVDDRPVPEARVLVNGINNGFERRTVVAPDGTFTMRGVPREVHVSIARPEEPTRLVKRTRVVIEPAANDEHEFVLPAAREALTWTVYDDLGKPLELVQIAIQSVDPDVPLRMTRFSDANGVAVLEDAAGLDLRVTVEAPGFVPVTAQIEDAPKQKEFSLVRGVKIKGRITAVRGRSAVAGAQVVIAGGTRRNSTVTSTLGEYEFTNVTPGGVQLRVSHDSFADKVLELVVEPTGYVDRPFEVPDIDLQDALTVRGTVVDANGRPVPAARVSPTPLPEVRPKNVLGDQTVVTDEHGRFTLRGLPPGSHTLHVQSALLGRGSADVTLREGDDAVDVSIVIDSALEADDAEFSRAVGSVALSIGMVAGRLVITAVPANGEAERAGLRLQDVLLAIDGSEITSAAAARHSLRGPINSDVVIAVRRDGTTHTFRVRREEVAK